jgi:hypothetical protein
MLIGRSLVSAKRSVTIDNRFRNSFKHNFRVHGASSLAFAARNTMVNTGVMFGTMPNDDIDKLWFDQNTFFQEAPDLFNLDTSLAVMRFDALYRPDPGMRHQLDFSYASYHRHGSRALSTDLTVGDVTYPVGATVDSIFNFDIIRGTYSYAIVQDDRMRISVGRGIYAIPLKYSLEGNATNGRRAVQGANTTLPFPALALGGEFQLVPKLFLYTGIDAMFLETSDFKGSLLEADVGLEYRPWKHLGFGLGYNSMLISLEGESSRSDYPGGDFIGKVKVNYSGLMLYGKFTF